MKYILREIGWVFNDSTYDNDGNYRTIEVFDTLEEAREVQKELNYDYFCRKFGFLHSYEAYGDFLTNFKPYKEKVSNYLIDKFGFNPTIRLQGKYDYSTSMFLNKPTIKEVEELLKVMNISFFSVTETDGQSRIQYEAKINGYYLGREDEYLWDTNGNKRLLFVTKREAIERFLKEHNYFLLLIAKIQNNARLVGSLESLSDLPSVLQSLINHSDHLLYKNGRLTLAKEMEADVFLQLNELLKEPFVKFEEKEVEIIWPTFENEHLSRMIQDERVWNTLSERNSRFNSLSDLKNSKEYLLKYTFRLSMYAGYYNYKDIIEDYFKQKRGEPLIEKYGYLYYKDVRIQMYGLIKFVKKVRNRYHIQSVFGFGNNPIPDLNYTAIGKHSEFERAFDNSLVNWLDKYGDLLVADLDKQV